MDRPKIVYLCGSTRFTDTFYEAAKRETLAGHIVLTIHAGGRELHDMPLKKELDALHFRKIELADEILVFNVNGYIGESTRNEISHATKLGKPIHYWEE